MTDTLADSRTSSRMFTEGVPLVVEDVRRRSAAERAEMLADPGFGRYFTDSMFVARYRAGRAGTTPGSPRTRRCSWTPAPPRCTTRSRSSRASRPTPSPTAASPPSGRRPTPPASPAAPGGWPCRRCRRTAFLAAVDALVDADRDWVPTGPDQTLYLRPYQLAVEPFLGVRPGAASTCSWSSPARPAPTSRAACTRCRSTSPRTTSGPRPAAPATSSAPATTPPACWPRSRRSPPGCDQVVWLDAVEKRYVEEMGGMNLFFVLGSGADAELVTPELTGTLLPGITRDSLITLARELATGSPSAGSASTSGAQGVADGTVTETFACGTAAVITPVGEVKARTGDFTVGDGSPGPAHHAAARARCWTSSTGGWPTPTAGCTGSPEPAGDSGRDARAALARPRRDPGRPRPHRRHHRHVRRRAPRPPDS